MSRFILWTLFVGIALIVALLWLGVIPRENFVELVQQALDVVQPEKPSLFGRNGIFQ